MQQENVTKTATSGLNHQDQQLLINNIKKTYEGKKSEQIKRAEQSINIMISMNQKSILLFLFKFIKPPYQMQRHFRMACANIIKKQFYRIAQNKQLDKETYIKQTYQTLSAVNYEDFSIKEVLNIGLEYIFNADDTSQYKNKWIEHVANQICALVENPDGWTLQTLEVLHGLVLILISYLNSLVQPIDQINFVNQILNYLCLTASLCGQFARNNINQSVSIKLLFIVQQKIFQFFELATQRLLQQQDQALEQIQKFKNSEKLSNILLQYLYMLCEGQTIITKYPQLNTIKASIIQILYIMNSYESEINIAIIQLLFTTFIYESQNRRNDDDDDWSYRIIYKTICILGSLLDKKNHYQFFLKNKMEIIFALLLYSRTTPEEQSYLFENPDKFAQIAQQFSQCYATSPLIKVKAATFIRIFVMRVDEGLSNLVQLCTIFIAGSLAPHETDSQILISAKQAFSKYQFWNLNQKQKLDISFMVLTVISPLVFKREDLKQIIISLIITNFNVISEVEDDLVRARLIRLVGYYTSSIYFAFIQKLMPYSKIYFLQGLCTFEKILKNKTYLEMFPIMHLVYLGFIDLVSVTDTIFERLILENYEKIMKKNDQLYIKCLQKIFHYFMESTQSMLQNSSKQHAIICLNYMQKMIKMQKSQKYLQVLGKYYCKMEESGIKIDLLVDNFVSIYQTLISKQMIVTKPVEQFVLNFSAPFRLFNYQNCSEYFLLLNKYILKSQNKDILQEIYNNLCNYLMQTQSEGFNFAILPILSHCFGHLIITHMNIKINDKFIQYMVHILTKKQKQESNISKNKQWHLFMMLHFIYVKPSIIRQLLLANKKYYPFMIAYFTTKFCCKIQRKAGILAAQQLLSYQVDANSRVQIIKYCVIQLNMQKERYQMKRPNNKKLKRNLKTSHQSVGVDYEIAEQLYLEEQAIQNEESSKKDEDNVYFRGFKHPFDQICEFSMFKHRIQSLSSHCKQVNNENIDGLTQVMRYEWHKNNVRRVLKISR